MFNMNRRKYKRGGYFTDDSYYGDLKMSDEQLAKFIQEEEYNPLPKHRPMPKTSIDSSVGRVSSVSSSTPETKIITPKVTVKPKSVWTSPSSTTAKSHATQTDNPFESPLIVPATKTNYPLTGWSSFGQNDDYYKKKIARLKDQLYIEKGKNLLTHPDRNFRELYRWALDIIPWDFPYMKKTQFKKLAAMLITEELDNRTPMYHIKYLLEKELEHLKQSVVEDKATPSKAKPKRKSKKKKSKKKSKKTTRVKKKTKKKSKKGKKTKK